MPGALFPSSAQLLLSLPFAVAFYWVGVDSGSNALVKKHKYTSIPRLSRMRTENEHLHETRPVKENKTKQNTLGVIAGLGCST